jgi:hypothetical protein
MKKLLSVAAFLLLLFAVGGCRIKCETEKPINGFTVEIADGKRQPNIKITNYSERELYVTMGCDTTMYLRIPQNHIQTIHFEVSWISFRYANGD